MGQFLSMVDFSKEHGFIGSAFMIHYCPCEHCGVHIEFDAENFQPGLIVKCPKCQGETELFLKSQAIQDVVHSNAVSPPILLPPVPPAWMNPCNVFCTVCHSVDEPYRPIKGNGWIELLLYFWIVPGIIYSIWRRAGLRNPLCRVCGSPLVIPTSSPAAKAHLTRLDEP
jgi:hypothetical protein